MSAILISGLSSWIFRISPGEGKTTRRRILLQWVGDIPKSRNWPRGICNLFMRNLYVEHA